jgi:hypothetical protein
VLDQCGNSMEKGAITCSDNEVFEGSIYRLVNKEKERMLDSVLTYNGIMCARTIPNMTPIFLDP